MDTKETQFNKEFRALITQSEEILKVRYKLEMSVGRPKKEILCLNRYHEIYNHMEPCEHYIYFENLLERHKYKILDSLNNDDWLKKDIVIQFGEGVKGFSKKCENIKIMLSEIYLCACFLRQSAEKTLSDLSPDLATTNIDMIRPSIILLHLMRIFYILCDEENLKTSLGVVLTQLETDLHIQNKTVPVTQTNLLANFKPADAISLLTNFVSIAKSTLKSSNIDLPDDFQLPDNDQITKVFTDVMENENTKKILNTFSNSLANKQDAGSTIQSLIASVNDPATIESMCNSVMKTAEIAKENTTQ